MMLCQAIQLARDIGLTDTPAESETKMSPEMRRVRAITSWGLFNLSSWVIHVLAEMNNS
jgi:hypothetical protein